MFQKSCMYLLAFIYICIAIALTLASAKAWYMIDGYDQFMSACSLTVFTTMIIACAFHITRTLWRIEGSIEGDTGPFILFILFNAIGITLLVFVTSKYLTYEVGSDQILLAHKDRVIDSITIGILTLIILGLAAAKNEMEEIVEKFAKANKELREDKSVRISFLRLHDGNGTQN